MSSTIIEYEQLLTAENIEKAITYFNNFNAAQQPSVKKVALALIDVVLNNRGKPLSNALLIHEIIETQAIENHGYKLQPSEQELSDLLRGFNIGVSQDYSRNLSSYLMALYPHTHPEAVKQTDEYLAL